MSLLFALMLAGLSLWVGDKNVPVSIFLAASAVCCVGLFWLFERREP